MKSFLHFLIFPSSPGVHFGVTQGGPLLIERISHRLRVYCFGVVCSVVSSLPLVAEDIRLKECPAVVRETIQQNLLGGDLDEIKEIRISDHVLYIVEIDLKGFREARLYIAGDGALRKIVQEIRYKDLPEAVRMSLEQYIKRPAKADDAEKVITEGETRYQVRIKPQKGPKRIVVFEEDGSISSDK